MKTTKKINRVCAAVVVGLWAVALPALATDAQATDINALKLEAAGVVKAFGGPLKMALEGGMKDGGPIHAIGACNEKAPSIAAAAMVSTGWEVARTSLKLRNPANHADAWELNVLNQFEARKAAGESPGTISFGEIVETNGQKQFRFMKAIGTAEVCLNCHGAELNPDVAAKLDGLYPEDTARGFSVGDIRGAFTLKKNL